MFYKSLKIITVILLVVVLNMVPSVTHASGGSFNLGSFVKAVVNIYIASVIFPTVGFGFLPSVGLYTAARTIECIRGDDNYIYSGCGGGSSSSSGGGGSSSTAPAANVADGKVGSCSLGNKLCGTNSCIPSEAVCCQNVGLNGYCPAGNVCTKDGTCEVATADNTTCSNLQGTKCISPANSCGQTNASSYKCDGSCTVFAAPDSGCATPDITLTVPSFVEYGKECLITSKVNNATSCSIDGTNVTVPNGTYKTPPIVATANFTMVCQNGSVVTASKTVTCRINPTFEEF